MNVVLTLIYDVQVRSYTRRAFTDEECLMSLNDVGLTSKQEALFLEQISG
jgi:hypothetical protein